MRMHLLMRARAPRVHHFPRVKIIIAMVVLPMFASNLLSALGTTAADGTLISTLAEIANTKRLQRNELKRLRYAAKAAAREAVAVQTPQGNRSHTK